MSQATLSEAEIQVLASIHMAEREDEPTDRSTLIKGGERYWLFREDWTDAFPPLLEKGLIEGDDTSYHLTELGSPLGAKYHAERPDMYWYYYQKFYPAARASAAHTKLCERSFGLDLTQEGMTDMTALHHLLQLLEPKEREHILDLGCGAGVIAEYIVEKTGVRVTGLDYAEPAIAEANERTRDKRDRLSFVTGDMNALDFPEQSFDTVISIDTLYWVDDLTSTMAQVAKLLKPGGQMGIFMLKHVPDGRKAIDYSAEETPLGRSLREIGLSFDAYDYTIQNDAFWYRNYQAAKDLQDEFEAEGNGFIAASLIREGEEDFLPFNEEGTLARYLYHVRA